MTEIKTVADLDRVQAEIENMERALNEMITPAQRKLAGDLADLKKARSDAVEAMCPDGGIVEGAKVDYKNTVTRVYGIGNNLRRDAPEAYAHLTTDCLSLLRLSAPNTQFLFDNVLRPASKQDEERLREALTVDRTYAVRVTKKKSTVEN